MSPHTFSLYVYWFRLQSALRSVRRTAQKQLGVAVPQIVAGLRWIAHVWLVPSWMFFVLSIQLWEHLEQRTRSRYLLRSWHRLLYCVGVSVVVGLGLALLQGWGVNESLLLAFGTQGLLLFVTWKRGARWLGKQLQVRPVRFAKAEQAYAGLDLGN